MRIAVIGIGNVGSVLGRRWAEAGNDVMFCVRDPKNGEKRDAAAKAGAALGPLGDAPKADVVLLAVPWREAPNALSAAGDLSGKVLLDCTNPVSADFSALITPPDGSSGEAVARLVPQARVVKIFNTNGAKNMADPNDGDRKVSMFYAGDDATANRVAADLAAAIGFEPIELGPLKYARLLEAMAMTWIVLSRQRGFGRDFALDLVRRASHERDGAGASDSEDAGRRDPA